jgi:Bacteriophage Sf6, terminase small subunit-like
MNTENNQPMVVNQHGKPGRPTKYEPETVERLLAGLADGLPIRSACIIAGIGVSTLSDWRDKHPELDERLAEAREKARLKMLQRIKRAAEDDWRAAAEFLRLTFPADYRRASNTQSVEVNTAVQQAVVCTEEQRMELIAQHKRLFGEADNAKTGGTG